MFEGEYSKGQSVDKCSEEGGIIAMATDQDTYNFLYQMFITYRRQDGTISGVYIDGLRDPIDPQSGDWFCLNTQGECPVTMPWHRGQPNNNRKHCARISAFLKEGAGNSYCSVKRMAFCKI